MPGGLELRGVAGGAADGGEQGAASLDGFIIDIALCRNGEGSEVEDEFFELGI